ncbi:FecR domain-containing protein [Nisaea acidiphila]|uniref:FecR domain-containing protein n=1 Tax=Nisaea acidiphila TaxID=1862145 RepID=A0A9J7AQ07_9PROT|nr:FecR domain-containing protein [Nisaea acidiphila]UUX49246.1 FecR domain-containing protein [Nisaea acidiphila]
MRRIFSGFAVLLMLVTAASAQSSSSSIGTIKVATGDASIMRGAQVLAAAEGMDVERADTLVTGTGGSLGVTLKDGTLISLGPNSQFELSAFEFSPRNDAFSFFGKILEGTLIYQSGRIGKIAPEKTRIETPLSVIAVRGTRFAVRVPAGAGN